MFDDSNIEQFRYILNAGLAQISQVRPSNWTEEHISLAKTGKFKYSETPYTREIIDCLAPDHPARKVVVMKGSQIGFTTGVILPGISWMIPNCPGNCYFMVGTPDLIENAVNRLDLTIDSAGIRNYISSQTLRKRNQKTGDTNFRKDFAGGWVKIGSANNHKSIAQDEVQYFFLDDLDAMKGKSAAAGSMLELFEMRAASFKNTYKMFLISTPLTKTDSNIEPAYLMGDQRRYMVECPNCHDGIYWQWEYPENKGGMIWELDNHGFLKPGSVGMVCPLCGGFHNDKNKMKQLQGGYWKPTEKSITTDYYSYHISSLYAPVRMFDWKKYVQIYLNAMPNNVRDERKYQTFVNTALGLTYEPLAEVPRSLSIMSNKRPYKIGTIPERMSIKHGNGRIVMVTCGADLNGKMLGVGNHDEDDARLDYEIVAHAENGATYSIQHGSIGTFQRGQAGKTDREKWTYVHNMPNSVWPVFEKLLAQEFMTDTGRPMQIALTAMDVGAYATTAAYPFLDITNNNVMGVKGDKEERYMLTGKDTRVFKRGLERPDLFILDTGLIKDRIAQYMKLRWDDSMEYGQPPHFMNFPFSENGLYEYANYFEHFESEARGAVKDKNGMELYIWKKKNSAVQNHMWDCRVYNLAAKGIALYQLSKDNGVTDMTWEEYVYGARLLIEEFEKRRGY